MTRDQLWQAYCKRNPAFANDDETVTLTARGLRKLFEQTWDLAQKERMEMERLADAIFRNKF